jgi:VCBS repeat-containing protein
MAESAAEQKAAARLAKMAGKKLEVREARERTSPVTPGAPPVAPNITATLTDSIIDISPADGRADPGSTITYTAVITNSGSDATGVSFMDTISPYTTLIGAATKVSPLAFADAYSATVGTPLTVAGPGVLSNDTGTPTPTAVPIAATGTTGGGTITLNADGGFTYTPRATPGPDSFSYTITNGQAPNDTATVSITVNASNTAPTAVDDTANAGEAGGTGNATGGTNPTGNVITGPGTDTDTEDPSSALTVVAVKTGPEGAPVTTGTVGTPLAGSYGSLTLNSNGSYTYTVDNNNATVQALRTSGNTLQDVFNYTVQDTGTLQDTASFTITILGANDAPTDTAITSSTVAENQPTNTVVGDFSTTDVDATDTFTYTLVAGAGSTDNGSFNINGAQLRTGASFNFEVKSSYAIRIRSTDAGGLFFEEQYTITVTNVNEAPTDIALSSNTIGENMPTNTVIGNFSTTDVDAGDTFTYSLVVGVGDTDNGSFNINGNQLRSSAIFDFETKSSYSIRVRSTDAGSLNFEKVFTITIVNNNDAPTDIALSNSSVPENSAINTVVGNFSTTDQDAGNTFTYTLVAGTGDDDNASFNILAAQLRTSASFDFETKSSYTIRVRSTDNSAAFFDKQFTITVTDVAEAPVLVTSGGSASFTEDLPAVAVDTGITVADQDSATLASATIQVTGNFQTTEDVLGFVNDGSTMGNVAISVAYNPVTGLLTLASASNTATKAEWQNALRAVTYNNTSQNPTTTPRTVTFKVKDPGALESGPATKGVTVTAVNDAPVLANSGAGLAYTENGVPAVINSVITVADVDSANITGATVSITLGLQANKDVLSFANTVNITGVYDGNTGVLTLSGTDTLANYQAALRNVKYNSTSEDPTTSARTVAFQVTDGNAVNPLSNVINSTVNVTATNDPPTATGYTLLPAQAGIPIAYPAGKLNGSDNAEEAANGTVVTIATTPDTVTNGTVVISGDGSFTFTPNSNGLAAQFTYHVNDNGKPGGGVSSTPATVSFTVAGPPLYFVKSVAVGTGTCTLGNECTLATAVTKMNTDGAGSTAIANAVAFISDANSHNPGTVTLGASGQKIVGQGVVATSFDSLFGIGTPGQGTLAARPGINASRPTVTGASTITANTGTWLRGFNYTPSGNGLVAAGKTSLIVSEMDITSTSNTVGQFAVNFTASSSGTFTFGPISTSGGSGVNFNTTTSASTVTFGNISTGAGAAFTSASTGTTNFTFNNVTTTTGAAVTVSSSGSGDFTFNDVTSTSGTAVSVTTATGDFIFHLISANGAAKGITVTSATGTFTVNGTSTTDGTGGLVQNCTSRGAEFITSNNVTLKNMNFTNNGVGGNDLNCTDALGATTNGSFVTSAACESNIHLQTVTTAILNNVNATGGDSHGLNGYQVNGLTLTNVDFETNGDAVAEDGVQLVNSTGTITVNGSSIFKDNAANQFEAQNGTGTATFNITGAFFGLTNFPTTGAAEPPSPGASTLNNGLQISASGTANMTTNVTGCTFDQNYADGYFSDYAGSAVMNVNLGTNASGNTFTNNGIGIEVGGNSTGSMTYFVQNNTITNNTAITGIFNTSATTFARSGAGGVWTGTIDNNNIGTNSAGATYSGCFVTNCSGMELTDGATSSANAYHVTVTNNEIYHVQGGITSNIGGILNGTPKTSFVITGNIIGFPDVKTPPGADTTAELNAIQINSGTLPSNIPQTCVEISGNTLNGNWGDPANHDSLRLRSRGAAGSIFRIRNWNGVGGDAGAMTFLEGINTISPGAGYDKSGFQVVTVSFTGGATACPLLLGAGGVMAALSAPSLLETFFSSASSTSISGPSDESNRAAGTISVSLDQKQLDATVAAAISRWSATGLSQSQLSMLRGIQFNVADLDGIYLGESDDDHIQIDRNAGGKGWFTGADSSSDLLFSRAVASTRRYTDPLSAPAGHLDLLTAIEHEMGHKLGLSDSYNEKDRDSLMYGYLTVGERRLPASGQGRNARPGSQGTQHLKLRAPSRSTSTNAKRLDKPITPLSGETLNLNIGTLAAGKSVTITFQVSLNASMPSGTSQVTTQGTVTYNSGPPPIANGDGDSPVLGADAIILTDDPGVLPNTGETDPTVTPIDAPTATGSSVSGQILDSNGSPVEGAAVRMTGTQNRLTVTDASGFYHFDDVETNGFYTVLPSRSNFTFSPSQRAFSQLGQHTDAVFVANSSGTSLNPLDTTEYFVRQQYVDFLGREPDEAGLGFWVNNIESCGNDAQCRAGKRIDTSAAFFLSIEFQQTGYLVYRTYQAAFGDMTGAPVPIKLGEFKPDTAAIAKDVIVNATGWETTLDNNKLAFMAEFVSRAKFVSAYPTSLSPGAFVDQLFAHAGVSPADGDRTAAISEFGSATTTADTAARGRALRRVAENTQLAQQEFTQAFVLMQYFGYLRRDPNAGQDTDYSGYSFWLGKLNGFNGNFGDAEMVKSFLISSEYRGRFPK